MKKVVFKLFLIVGLMMPLTVRAFTDVQLSLDCSNMEPLLTETVQCVLKANVIEGKTINNLEFGYELSNLSLISPKFTASSVVKTSKENTTQKKYTLELNNQIGGNFELGTLSLKAGAGSSTYSGDASIKINLKTVSLCDSSCSNVSETSASAPLATASQAMTVMPTLNGLSSPNTKLKLNPAFSKTVNSYELTVLADTTDFKLSGLKPSNSKDSVTVEDAGDAWTPSNGTVNLTIAEGVDTKEFNIKVKLHDSDKVTIYKVTVRRSGSSGSLIGNPYLSSLTVAGNSVSLDNTSTNQETINHSLSSVTSYQVKAVLSDTSGFKFSSDTTSISGCSVSNGTLTCNLSGEKSISIKVESKTSGGASKTYVLNVVQGSDNSGGGNSNVPSNPQTGAGLYIVSMGLAVLSLVLLYFYKKRMDSCC